jgi:hypothetical protein
MDLGPLRALAFVAVAALGVTTTAQDRNAPQLVLTNSNGLRLVADADPVQPRVRVILPGQPLTDRTIDVLLPEHVTVATADAPAGRQLFLPASGTSTLRPQWRMDSNRLWYRLELPGSIGFVARAALEVDGVLVEYEFENRSASPIQMITAVTDPRLTGIFHDRRLERTYVHHANGFDLLASEVPQRLTMPFSEWLPARVLAAFTWPVPDARIERGADGIPRYQKSRKVDVPMVATQSTDKSWVVASFSRSPGNVWSNPELTCQHVDPQSALNPGQRAFTSVKILVIRGSLDAALEKARRQGDALR